MQREYSTKVLAIRSPLLNYPMAQPEFQHIEKDDSWGDTHMRVYKEDNGGATIQVSREAPYAQCSSIFLPAAAIAALKSFLDRDDYPTVKDVEMVQEYVEAARRELPPDIPF